MKRNYKTINGLAKECNNSQLTLEDILHCRAHHNKYGWIDINDLMDEDLAQYVADLLGGQSKTKQDVKNSLLYNGKRLRHWGLQRIIYSNMRKNFTYVAGQDYTYETKEIRNAIK
jgi:hypothetical protein